MQCSVVGYSLSDTTCVHRPRCGRSPQGGGGPGGDRVRMADNVSLLRRYLAAAFFADACRRQRKSSPIAEAREVAEQQGWNGQLRACATTLSFILHPASRSALPHENRFPNADRAREEAREEQSQSPSHRASGKKLGEANQIHTSGAARANTHTCQVNFIYRRARNTRNWSGPGAVSVARGFYVLDW